MLNELLRKAMNTDLWDLDFPLWDGEGRPTPKRVNSKKAWKKRNKKRRK